MKFHFISGLPRAGSTLLAALLRQNPSFHAAMTSPMFSTLRSIIKSMADNTEFGLFFDDAKRRRILTAAMTAYYEDKLNLSAVFDTSRAWCSAMPLVANLFPTSKVICCVRNPAWILDSMECHFQKHVLRPARVFNFEPIATVRMRVDIAMKSPNAVLGTPLGHLRDAWYGSYTDRLLVVRYESLTRDPENVMRALYNFLNETYFPHDFENFSYTEPDYDERNGLPGFHAVRGPIRLSDRPTVLPLDIFQAHNGGFWEKPGQNPRKVSIL